MITTDTYSKVAALIRFTSGVCTIQFPDSEQFTLSQLSRCVKEFLAFFCTIACNEICKDKPEREAVAQAYAALREAFNGPQNEDLKALKVGENVRLAVAEMVNGPEARFNSYFWSYWNGDLSSLRISPADIEELSKRGCEPPRHGHAAAAAYALLIRVSKHAVNSPANVLPPTIVIAVCDDVIGKEVAKYVERLKAILADQA